MSLKRRLAKLEEERKGAADSRPWEVPAEVNVLLKTHERARAREEGEEPPPYSPAEIQELRQNDIEIVAGSLRDNVGWQSPTARAQLDEWEEDARRRLDMAEGLPPERWGEVWGDDEEETDEERSEVDGC